MLGELFSFTKSLVVIGLGVLRGMFAGDATRICCKENSELLRGEKFMPFTVPFE